MDKIHIIMQKRLKWRKVYNLLFLKIKLTPRNIFVTLTDTTGAVLLKNSTGLLGYKGSKKTTPFVASSLVKSLLKKMLTKNIKYNCIVLQYNGDANDSQVNGILRALKEYKLKNLLFFEFLEKEAHNGVRAKKKSR